MFLAEFDFMMEHKPGKTNCVADVLNRRGELASLFSPTFLLASSIQKGLQHDPQAKNILEAISGGKTPRFWVRDRALMTKGNIFMRLSGKGYRRRLWRSAMTHFGRDIRDAPKHSLRGYIIGLACEMTLSYM